MQGCDSRSKHSISPRTALSMTVAGDDACRRSAALKGVTRAVHSCETLIGAALQYQPIFLNSPQ